MNKFSNSTFMWWQISLLKISTVTFGIAVGAYWSNVFLPYLVPIIIVSAATGAYVAYVYFLQH